MMDWVKQTQDLFKTWMDTQQKMWANWTDATQSAADSQSSNLWSQSVNTWANGFKNFVETQALWARMWARNMISGSESRGAEAFVKAVEDMTHMWVDMQQKLWNNWFEIVRQFNPADITENTQGQMLKAMESWQSTLGKIMDAQTEWTKQWAEMIKTGGEKK